MTPHINLIAPGSVAPGVDIVFPTSEEAIETVLDRRTMKLVGSLHRRFWERRGAMLKNRALMGQGEVDTLEMGEAFGDVVADLRNPDSTWETRVAEFSGLRDALALDAIARDGVARDGIARDGRQGQAGAVRARGWLETETGVLVDGRAVPGCVFDVVVAMFIAVDLLREGTAPFIIEIPEAQDGEEAKLWSDLLLLAEDRLGVERGTVTTVSLSNTASLSDVDELAVA